MALRILQQVDGGSVGQTISIQETYITTQGQSVFNLNGTYIPDTNSIEVYVEGVLMNSKTLDEDGNPIVSDYMETSTSSVTFNNGLDENLVVTIKFL